jgi:membrane protease subunit HflC
MNKRTSAFTLGIAIVLVLVLYSTTYTVNFHEFAIRTRFGVPAGVEREAGLHFKFPFFVDSVTKIDRRLQFAESPLQTVQTSDGLQVVVRAYLFWKVKDSDKEAQDFFVSYGGSLDSANSDLEQTLAGAVKAVGGFRFEDLVGPKARLADAEKAILAGVAGAQKVGVEPVAVGLSQIVLPQKTTVSVLSRMSEVQNTLAKLENAKANSAAEALRSQAKSQSDTIVAFANQWASRIEGRGSEEATAYYERMKQYSELATFLAWLDAMRAGLRGSTTFIGDTTRAPFHLLDFGAAVDGRGVPQPAEEAAAKAAASASESAGATEEGGR